MRISEDIFGHFGKQYELRRAQDDYDCEEDTIHHWIDELIYQRCLFFPHHCINTVQIWVYLFFYFHGSILIMFFSSANVWLLWRLNWWVDLPMQFLLHSCSLSVQAWVLFPRRQYISLQFIYVCVWRIKVPLFSLSTSFLYERQLNFIEFVFPFFCISFFL